MQSCTVVLSVKKWWHFRVRNTPVISKKYRVLWTLHQRLSFALVFFPHLAVIFTSFCEKPLDDFDLCLFPSLLMARKLLFFEEQCIVSQHNVLVKSKITLIQLQVLFVMVTVLIGPKWISHFCNRSCFCSSCSSVLFILFIFLFLEASWLGNKHFACLRVFFATAVKKIDNIFTVETYR